MAAINPRATTRSVTRTSTRTPAQIAALAFGVVYLVIGLAGWAVTSDFTGIDDDAHLLGFHLNGAHNVVHLALGVVWIADTAAYFAGRRFGRRKLAPSISPGKTWEGVIGAFAGVGVYYALLWFAWAPEFLTGSRASDLLLVAGMLALSVEGDLFESWVKRRAGVKDSGTLLPGHGGVLDRIDGVIAAMPLAALGSVLTSS